MEKENNFGSILGGILGIVFLLFMGWWIFNIVFSDKTNNTSGTSDCGNGYHWEEDRMMINGGCVSD